ncbi:MAG: SurA N-terminal domain-containing protein [Lentisphaerales bacterium]|nr:SurA N-terminal domain-containing protein [Lentisphaerales bacterium]
MYKYIFHILVMSSILAQANEIIYSDGILAKVNGKIITNFELNQMTQRSQGRIIQTYAPEIAKQRIAELKKSALDQFINNVIILDEFKAKKFEVPKALIEKELQKEIDQRTGGKEQDFYQMLDRGGLSIEEYKEQIMESLAIELMVNENVKRKVSVTPVDITNYYNDNLDRFVTNAEVRGAIILIAKAGKTDAEYAQKVGEVQEALKNGKDFAELADSVSEMPGKPKGGDLGFKKMDELNESIRPIIEKMKVGDYTDPVLFGENTAFVKVLEKRGGESLELIKVRDRIKSYLQDEQERKYYNEFISGLRKKASIEEFTRK